LPGAIGPVQTNSDDVLFFVGVQDRLRRDLAIGPNRERHGDAGTLTRTLTVAA
jgi:hypothetical protein